MSTATHTFFPTVLSFGVTFMDWFEGLMQRAYEASSIAQELEQINAMSDADLAANGLTREQAVRNIAARFGHV